MKGLRAMPVTDVKPKRDMGSERALSPFQTSAIEPHTILMLTDDAPPPNYAAEKVSRDC
jgi:hypothetical protein